MKNDLNSVPVSPLDKLPRVDVVRIGVGCPQDFLDTLKSETTVRDARRLIEMRGELADLRGHLDDLDL